MLDNLSLRIEELAAKENSYIEAVLIFSEKFGYQEYEDILEILHPNIKEKLRQEFIDKKFLPNLKQKDSIESFFS